MFNLYCFAYYSESFRRDDSTSTCSVTLLIWRDAEVLIAYTIGLNVKCEVVKGLGPVFAHCCQNPALPSICRLLLFHCALSQLIKCLKEFPVRHGCLRHIWPLKNGFSGFAPAGSCSLPD